LSKDSNLDTPHFADQIHAFQRLFASVCFRFHPLPDTPPRLHTLPSAQ
jgi:hypothetical protein